MAYSNDLGVSAQLGDAFPVQQLGVEAGLQTLRSVDPRALPVGEAGPVVDLAPHHQTAGGLLPRLLLDRMELLVLQAGADRVRAFGGVDQGLECGEAEDELAVARGRRRRGKRDEHPGDEQCHQSVFHDAPLGSGPVRHRPVAAKP